MMIKKHQTMKLQWLEQVKQDSEISEDIAYGSDENGEMPIRTPRSTEQSNSQRY